MQVTGPFAKSDPDVPGRQQTSWMENDKTNRIKLWKKEIRTCDRLAAGSDALIWIGMRGWAACRSGVLAT
jgi:hypothetical protein